MVNTIVQPFSSLITSTDSPLDFDLLFKVSAMSSERVTKASADLQLSISINSNVLNIKLFLKTATILPEHTDINKELDKWIEIKSSNLSKLQHILSYLPPKKDKKDGK